MLHWALLFATMATPSPSPAPVVDEGGLHVSRAPRVRAFRSGIPVREVAPVALLSLYHPGAVHVIQSMGRAADLGVPELVGSGDPVILAAAAARFDSVAANQMTSLRNRDGSVPEVYGPLMLSDIVDAVLLWDPQEVTLQAPDEDVFRIDWYWDELNRRSRLLTGRAMDPGLRQEPIGGLVPG